MDWNDLKYFLTSARTGSCSAAARALGVNHATVSRRLSQLEAQLNARLFERGRTGLTLTEAGASVLGLVERAETTIFEVERKLLGQNASLSGPLSVTMVDTLAVILAETIQGFTQQHPGIELELTADSAMRDLSRREADVALRVVSGSPPEYLVGRRLVTVAYAPYARRDLEGSPRWVVWGPPRSQAQTQSWLARFQPNAEITSRVSSGLIAAALLRAGAGAALLPCILGDNDPALSRLSPPSRVLDMQLWALVHPDLRQNARARAFLDHIAAALRSPRPDFEGDLTTAPRSDR